MLLIFSTLGALTVAEGFGLDAWDVENLSLALGLFFWDEIFYVMILGLCKISILTFYLRIFPHQKFRKFCYIILGWVALNTVVFTLSTLLQCIPISTNWTGWEKKGGRDKCLNLNAQSFASAAINIAQDIIILLLPIPWLLRLRVTLKKKFHVLFMFSLGFFICICSIVRIFTVEKFTDHSSNPTRDFVDVTYWTAIETYVTVVVPNLPAIRSFLSLKFPGIFGLDSRAGEYERSQPAPPTGTGESIELTLTGKTNVSLQPRAIENESYFSNSRIGTAL
ncbi:hypothetical protein IFR04_009189 [Cadophora malorum]|uniref:Rhodopsin domain-containing protein n=1 Tax=Cadophora malorum TaxID=108018 RepID=A0A8H7W4V1_9HELO|nr:hypothetical protein IFR04_009189 [Cadophora malorum]